MYILELMARLNKVINVIIETNRNVNVKRCKM